MSLNHWEQIQRSIEDAYLSYILGSSESFDRDIRKIFEISMPNHNLHTLDKKAVVVKK